MEWALFEITLTVQSSAVAAEDRGCAMLLTDDIASIGRASNEGDNADDRQNWTGKTLIVSTDVEFAEVFLGQR